jgi:hypothetical protein
MTPAQNSVQPAPESPATPYTGWDGLVVASEPGKVGSRGLCLTTVFLPAQLDTVRPAVAVEID